MQQHFISNLSHGQNPEANIAAMSALRVIISLWTWMTHRFNIERQQRGAHWYEDPSASRGL